MTVRVPHRVVIAPSGFKESLDAEQVADAIAAGVRRALPGAVVFTAPVVDGGEGSARTLASATGGRVVERRVTGPVGDPVESHFAMLGRTPVATALVEMAAAAGLRHVPVDRRDPTRTTTYGVGELILAALDEGARRIVVGCGDSGTSDGGAGALVALGARVLDRDGRPIDTPGGAALADAASLDLSGLDPRLAEVEMVVGCNLTNVLCGPRGVARVFGPQKGATEQQVEQLSDALDTWAGVLEAAASERGVGGLDVRHGAGTGASGGLGAALAVGCGAELRSRFEVFLHDDLGAPEIDAAIAQADLVITAEGAVDYQTPRGKVPAEVARRAKLHGKPVMALAGSIGTGAADVHDIGIDAVVGIIPIPMELAQAVEQASDLVAQATERALRLVVLGAVISSAA
ncbi:glycerate kinase [Barrientosiimonas humi]|uniref:Glycerate kinase n=1 Tax=Barrientosiimonas humi TaxID=999931 RepID=A0A542X889_9MICO|nr:glycerate kinase [Barrientosiimonas humi]TQL31966.1 glycerate kinase [Barrientosiimonas humi]CAG7571822.1 Glycerate 2-kinase [Barrientosiimonas humi]